MNATLFRLLRPLLPACLLCTAMLAQTSQPAPMPLWPAGAPGAKGSAPEDIPSIQLYQPPADKANGAAIVVCPGGGYHILAIEHEGTQVCE
ncbi:MAG TPA: alpha/beta hydrolase, partial [Blastocatellia bacterium]|nr:alpha/beta hydrolase [Blastocatellia bacterium]